MKSLAENQRDAFIAAWSGSVDVLSRGVSGAIDEALEKALGKGIHTDILKVWVDEFTKIWVQMLAAKMAQKWFGGGLPSWGGGGTSGFDLFGLLGGFSGLAGGGKSSAPDQTVRNLLGGGISKWNSGAGGAAQAVGGVSTLASALGILGTVMPWVTLGTTIYGALGPRQAPWEYTPPAHGGAVPPITAPFYSASGFGEHQNYPLPPSAYFSGRYGTAPPYGQGQGNTLTVKIDDNGRVSTLSPGQDYADSRSRGIRLSLR